MTAPGQAAGFDATAGGTFTPLSKFFNNEESKRLLSAQHNVYGVRTELL